MTEEGPGHAKYWMKNLMSLYLKLDLVKMAPHSLFVAEILSNSGFP